MVAKILPLWMLLWLFLQATRTFSRTSCMEYILRKGGWVKTQSLITCLKREILLCRGKRISGGIISLVHLTGLIRLWNYIHWENVDSHIHTVYPTYKYSFNIQSPSNALSEVAWEDTLATSELELQSISGKTSKHLKSEQSQKLSHFLCSFYLQSN